MVRYLHLTLIILLTILEGCKFGNYIQEGTVTFNNYYKNIIDSTSVPFFGNSYRIWFKDSLAIYEVNTIMDIVIESPKGTVRKIDVIFSHYAFIDLKTFKCQNYLHFSDTALPISTYQITSHDFLGWKFYAMGNPLLESDQIINLPDTIINKRPLKRAIVKQVRPEFTSAILFYLDPKNQKSIFHINKAVEKHFPGFRIAGQELISPGISTNLVMEYSFLSTQLSASEKAIFLAWEKNLYSGKYKQVDFTEAQKNTPGIKKAEEYEP